MVARRALLVAAAVSMVAVPTAYAGDDKEDKKDKQGQSGDAPGNSGNAPGQNKDTENTPQQQETPAAPAQDPAPAAPQGNGNGQSDAKQEKAAGKSDEARRGQANGRDTRGDKPSKAQGPKSSHGNSGANGTGSAPKPRNPHGKAGKVTICHSTSKGYVTITMSRNALAVHARHHSGRDIVPAPAGGCPGATAKDVKRGVRSDKPKKGKVTLCHATGSVKNPYVVITISERAAQYHVRHHAGRDIIPAPAGGCQGSTTDTPAVAGLTSTVPGASGAPGGGAVLGASESGGTSVIRKVSEIVNSVLNPLTPASVVRGSSLTDLAEEVEDSSGITTAGGGEVLGSSVSSVPAAATADTPVTLDDDAEGSLPFTGWNAVLAFALALAAVLAGVALRRSARETT